MKRTPAPLDPFPFGWRYRWQIGDDGRKHSVQVPLTLDDVLHPQEGDHIPENSQQEKDRRYIASVLEWRLADDPQAVVLSDCLINWGVKGLGNHSPDVSVFEGVAHPKPNYKTFRVAVEGAHPLLVIEIVSPDKHHKQARDNDALTKVQEYYRAGVPLYVLVDQEREDGPRRLVGYQRGARKYVSLRPDAQGRLLLAPVRLLLGLRDGRSRCWDVDTGEEIGGLTEMAKERDTEARARQAAESALAQAQARIRDLEAKARRK